MEHICAQTGLQVLHLGEATFLTDAAAALIAARLPRLRSLRITQCDGIMDEGARALAPMTALEDLDLSSTGVLRLHLHSESPPASVSLLSPSSALPSRTGGCADLDA
jgi:hypothetical protein